MKGTGNLSAVGTGVSKVKLKEICLKLGMGLWGKNNHYIMHLKKVS